MNNRLNTDDVYLQSLFDATMPKQIPEMTTGGCGPNLAENHCPKCVLLTDQNNNLINLVAKNSQILMNQINYLQREIEILRKGTV